MSFAALQQALSEYQIGPIRDENRATFGVEESQGASVTLKIPRVSPFANA